MPFVIKKIDPFNFAGSGRLRREIEVETPYGSLQAGQVLPKGMSFSDYVKLATGGTVIPDPEPEPDPIPDPIPDPEPEPDPIPDPIPDPEPEPEPEPDPDPDPIPDPDPQPQPVFNPTITQPDLVFNPLVQGLAETGNVVTLQITGSFDRGTITGALDGGVWNPSLQQAFRAGPLTMFGLNVNAQGEVDKGTVIPFTHDVTVQTGMNTVLLRAHHEAGPAALRSDGTVFAAGLPAGILTQTRTFQGALPYFATTADNATMTKQPLVPMTTEQVEIIFAPESAENRNTFWIPDGSWQVAAINYFNLFMNAFDPADQSANWIMDTVTIQVNGVQRQYLRFRLTGLVRLQPFRIRVQFT